MRYEVLSPWAEAKSASPLGICPRVSGLEGKTVGLFAHFKEHSPVLLDEVAVQLRGRFPTCRFVHLQYPKDTKEIIDDPEFELQLREWLKGVDTVVAAYGDAGSCAMYLAYNVALIEKLGTPCAILSRSDLVNASQRGASARQVPALRIVTCEMPDLSYVPVIDGEVIHTVVRPAVEPVLDGLIAALTAPVSEAEGHPVSAAAGQSSLTFVGTLEEVSDYFYKNGWTNGTPVIPPTEENVARMLEGTDLSRDHVVGYIPPMLGKATVEKIAINAVMAGCLPTYFPVVLAAVKGMLDARIHLEGWTCSVSAWFPLITVSGPVTEALHMNSGGAMTSPYDKASACIARAVAYVIMNIGGVRPGLEDMSALGHESRFGMCIAETMVNSPWGPLHTDFGFAASDSAVTMFWPQIHYAFGAVDVESALRGMSTIPVGGWDPGCCFLMTVDCARLFAEAGFSKKDVLDYVVEYVRRPASEMNVRWHIGNHHEPRNVLLPRTQQVMARKFWSTDHMFIVVGGNQYPTMGLVAYVGGGDHGGPSCTKIDLPAGWDALVRRYDDVVPSYVRY